MRKQVKKVLKKKKTKRTVELRAFKKMSVSDSDQESINGTSSEEKNLN